MATDFRELESIKTTFFKLVNDNSRVFYTIF